MSTQTMRLHPFALCAAAALQACAHPSFVVPDRPTLVAASEPPPLPKPQAVVGSVDQDVVVDAVRAGERPTIGEIRLALLPVAVHEASQAHMGDATATVIEDLMPRKLLEHGLSHFLGPDVLMAVPAEKQATRDGTIRWNAPLGVLMQVEPVVPADLILELEVREAQKIDAEVPVSWVLDAAEASAYAQRYDAWKPAVEDELAGLRDARSHYVSGWDAAAKAYEKRHGKYDGGDEPTPGDLAREERSAVLARLDGRIDVLERQLSETPSPEAFGNAVSSRQETREKSAYRLAVRTELIDARTLEVQWLADISTQDDEQLDAVRRVLDAVIAGVR